MELTRTLTSFMPARPPGNFEHYRSRATWIEDHPERKEMWTPTDNYKGPRAVPEKPRQEKTTGESFEDDEDWTKVHDSVNRRRLQNRIAQRNYRASST